MSGSKKAAANLQVIKGAAKKTIGRVTGNRRLHAEGRRDQVRGKARRAGAKVMAAFRR
jgi:uncharacterized protein YjbJ (UPF0337 family)